MTSDAAILCDDSEYIRLVLSKDRRKVCTRTTVYLSPYSLIFDYDGRGVSILLLYISYDPLHPTSIIWLSMSPCHHACSIPWPLLDQNLLA